MKSCFLTLFDILVECFQWCDVGDVPVENDFISLIGSILLGEVEER